ncbi:hypothetical protein [Octadecabacter ascidiaceicola]|uniref:Uncharacterized protein n=1 Tax=Octadecabacter ascidiaceicola TaxID=1655543 RepID=A0A238JM64_9RHOB|nr:hypothetical protein [Octadecabacter ascidiaceicola]SMX31759.1 hypothetical protein OCA8868_00512 [Octadecabacter ascidiaceicola]
MKLKLIKGVVLAGIFLGAMPAAADNYAARHIALTEAFTREMSRVGGGDQSWTVPTEMAVKMTCAIGELERRRGVPVVEEYLRWSAWAVEEAGKLQGVEGFGTLISQIHIRSGIDFDDDLGPITDVCGIGL